MRRYALAVLLLAAVVHGAGACTVSASELNFGPINPLESRETDSFATLQVGCPTSTGYVVRLSTGEGSFGDRRMRWSNALLQYNVYVDPGHSSIWGDGTGGSATVSGQAGPMPTTHTAYGRVPAQPLAIPGLYVDVIVVTIDY